MKNLRRRPSSSLLASRVAGFRYAVLVTSLILASSCRGPDPRPAGDANASASRATVQEASADVPAAPGVAPLPAGKSSISIDVCLGDPNVPASKLAIECFTYKPAGWDGRRLILVHHGVLRNADEYRDHAVVLGDRFHALIVAPRFDAERFPSRKYQRGGILRADDTAADPSEWTYAAVPQIAARVRELEGRPAMKHWIIGHSAGGQFAMRMSAFQATGAERIVAANPGTDLFPTREMEFGYGFGKLPASLSDDERLKQYLAAPLTLYLGTADDHPDEDLDVTPAANLQGVGRFQRGHAAYARAASLARERGWPFHWRLVEAEGVPHDHEKMFAHAACEDALFGPLSDASRPAPAAGAAR